MSAPLAIATLVFYVGSIICGGYSLFVTLTSDHFLTRIKFFLVCLASLALAITINHLMDYIHQLGGMN